MNYPYWTKNIFLFFENKIHITTLNSTKLHEKYYFLVTAMCLSLWYLLLNKHFRYIVCDWIHKESSPGILFSACSIKALLRVPISEEVIFKQQQQKREGPKDDDHFIYRYHLILFFQIKTIGKLPPSIICPQKNEKITLTYKFRENIILILLEWV